MIKGVKGFNSDMTCRGFKYEVGKEYTHEGEVKACSGGFHFCENPLDVLGHYGPATSKFCEVEGDGEISKDGSDSKVACSQIKIGPELSINAFVKLAIEFIHSKIDKTKKQTIVNGTASNTGDYSAASNTGYQSAASNTGDYSAASNTGDQSVASNTGYQSVASNTGYQSAASNTGNRSAASNTGNWSAASNTGYQSAASNTGDYSAASNTGYQSAAMAIGIESSAEVSGAESCAISLGIRGKAKANKGSFITLAEWGVTNGEWHRASVKSVKVDGKKIKADTFYTLEGGKFVEVK